MANISTYVGAGGGGATAGGESLTATTCIALTSDNSSALEVCYSGIGCLYLPDATTLETGTGLYTVKNVNTNKPVQIYDYCQNLYNSVPPFGSTQISLYDNTCAAGGWIIENPQPNLEKIGVEVPLNIPGGLDIYQLGFACETYCRANPNYYYFIAGLGNTIYTAAAIYNSSSCQFEASATQTCVLCDASSGGAISCACFLDFNGDFYHGGAVATFRSGHIVSIACDGTACVTCDGNNCWLNMCNCETGGPSAAGPGSKVLFDGLDRFIYAVAICNSKNFCVRYNYICPTTGALTTECAWTMCAGGSPCASAMATLSHQLEHYHYANSVRCRIAYYKFAVMGVYGTNGSCVCLGCMKHFVNVACDASPGFCYACELAIVPAGTCYYGAPYAAGTDGSGCCDLNCALCTALQCTYFSFNRQGNSGYMKFWGSPCRFRFTHLAKRPSNGDIAVYSVHSCTCNGTRNTTVYNQTGPESQSNNIGNSTAFSAIPLNDAGWVFDICNCQIRCCLINSDGPYNGCMCSPYISFVNWSNNTYQFGAVCGCPRLENTASGNCYNFGGILNSTNSRDNVSLSCFASNSYYQGRSCYTKNGQGKAFGSCSNYFNPSSKMPIGVVTYGDPPLTKGSNIAYDDSPSGCTRLSFIRRVASDAMEAQTIYLCDNGSLTWCCSNLTSGNLPDFCHACSDAARGLANSHFMDWMGTTNCVAIVGGSHALIYNAETFACVCLIKCRGSGPATPMWDMFGWVQHHGYIYKMTESASELRLFMPGQDNAEYFSDVIPFTNGCFDIANWKGTNWGCLYATKVICNASSPGYATPLNSEYFFISNFRCDGATLSVFCLNCTGVTGNNYVPTKYATVELEDKVSVRAMYPRMACDGLTSTAVCFEETVAPRVVTILPACR